MGGEEVLLMVMELCGGGDLLGYYPRPSFSAAEFSRVSLELLSAVAFMHQRGIGHHDLKPVV